MAYPVVRILCFYFIVGSAILMSDDVIGSIIVGVVAMICITIMAIYSMRR